MKSFIYKIFLFQFLGMLYISTYGYASTKSIHTLNNLNSFTNEKVKQLREDIRKSIYIIKSRRPVEHLPDLKFYKYIIKKDDTFWKVLSKVSLDIDTLMSVNFLSTPKDIVPGKVIYIPNMRGVLLKNPKIKKIIKLSTSNRVSPKYICKVNKIKSLEKNKNNFLFIPCGKISNLERSLFIGTGFIHPLKGGRRTSGFGTRRNPFSQHSYEFHGGIDIACSMKSQVLAARKGEVIFTGPKDGYGNLIIVRHEHGYHSLYGHLSQFKVKVGEKVKLGQVIAYSGNTGRTTGPHLHFEVRKGQKAINPGILLKLYKE